MKKLSFIEMNQYLSKEQTKNLQEKVFMETYDAIFDFVVNSEKIYTAQRETPEKALKTIAEVINSVMGSGKSTALQVISKQVLNHDIPLLCVFNNKDNLKEYKDHVYKEGKVLVLDSENYTEDVTNNIKYYQIVAITQQRLRDLKLGFGDFADFKIFVSNEGVEPLQRTIIIDEMPIFINSEVFDVGKENNSLDWYDEFATRSTYPKIGLERARAIIPYLIVTEMAETFDIEEEESRCLPTRRLIRHIEQLDEQKQTLLSVLDDFKKIKCDYKNQNRYNWFMKLLNTDYVGVVSRENKRTVILCSSWLDYREFGNIMVLDGTSNITQSIYRNGEFQLIRVRNYHNYSKRLKIHHQVINTSKTNRKNDAIQNVISDDIISIRNIMAGLGRDIIPLPSKDDIETYHKTGAITKLQFERFFKGKTFENDSMALNLLNTTGKNDLASYSSIGLLALPIRNPSYYKLYAIAMYGTKTNISLLENHERKLSRNESIGWFADEKVQTLFKELVLADISQIIHRTALRYFKENSLVDVYLYTNRKSWIAELSNLYGLGVGNIETENLLINSKFEDSCRQRLGEAIKHMQARGRRDVSLGEISRAFKDWFNRNWKFEGKRKIILKVAEEYGLEIDENPITGYKTLTLY